LPLSVPLLDRESISSEKPRHRRSQKKKNGGRRRHRHGRRGQRRSLQGQDHARRHHDLACCCVRRAAGEFLARVLPQSRVALARPPAAAANRRRTPQIPADAPQTSPTHQTTPNNSKTL
jgi:hypothetical protein